MEDAEANQANEPKIEILYEQGSCLVVLKPSGVLTQAPPGIDSLEQRIKAFLDRRDNRQGKLYLGIPHRLDRPVSGAMVFGKSRRAARHLAEQFEGRLVGKTYWAVVEGRLDESEGTWRDFMRKVPGEARAEVVARNEPDARSAVLHYRVLGTCEAGTFLEIILETGRTHQIRVQAATRGHPIVGDTQYGATSVFGPLADNPRDQHIALHARSLAFEHPRGRTSVSIVAPLPSDWRALGLDLPEDAFKVSEEV